MKLRLNLLLLLVLFACGLATAGDYPEQRRALVEEIEAHVTATRERLGKAMLAPRVLKGIGEVPRHEFVPKSIREYAYQNRPLPIGHGQTISQPYIVAIMTDLIDPQPGDRVLEIGTGSGYQAAILAGLVARVYSMEIIRPLGESATQRLAGLGYDNVSVRVADGYFGWEDAAPFDAIVVTAAASHIPPPLLKQLKPGGRMIIPVGSRFLTQQLLLVEKGGDDEVFTRQILPVSFVPFTGGH